MVPIQDISKAKAVSILAYLESLGHRPHSQQGREWAYRSPLQEERTPSFFVNTVKNVFADYSSQEQGDSIRLVRLLTGQDFPSAVQELLNFQGHSFSFSGPLPAPIPAEPGQPAIEVIAVRPLTHSALLHYVQSRGISSAVAQTYCQEVHYLAAKGRTFYAVGFANDCGGFVLRSANFKGQTAPAGFTTISGPRRARANVFEGFFNFLSAVQLFGSSSYASIVLNSTNNVTKALPVLRNFDSLNLYLDLDKAGQDAVGRLKKEGLNVIDRSERYAGFNDLNHYLVNQ
ncbi:MAG: CHC2 zinc finger domain-containing protein [Cytophagaceae bacterium]|nr:CHC2 zinc finger domain-containing protein [Cytophagaceae bacterium]